MEEYREVAGWAETIKELVVDHRMPPWGVSPASGPFKDDLRLSEEEIGKIVAWVDAGAPSGDLSQAPKFPQFTDGWQLGKPDLVVTLPEFVAQPGDEDYFPTLQVTLPLPGERWIRAFEVLPSNRKIMHHAGIVFGPSAMLGMSEEVQVARQEPPSMADRLRNRIRNSIRDRVRQQMQQAEGPGPLARLINPAQFFEGAFGFLGAIAAGTPPREYPQGFGVPIKPLAGKVTFTGMMHYHPTPNTVERDQTRIGIYFGKGPLKHVVRFGSTGFAPINIAPGDGDFRTRISWTAPRDLLLLSLSPHMHYRGREMTMLAHLPDGSSEVLVSVPRYDFNYQWSYDPVEPIRLPAGTRIEALARLDNSESNPHNPDASQRVRLGPNSTDEMAVGLFVYAWANSTTASGFPGDPLLSDWLERNASRFSEAEVYRGYAPGFMERSAAALILQQDDSSWFALTARGTVYEIPLGKLQRNGLRFSQPGHEGGYGPVTVQGHLNPSQQSATATITVKTHLKNPIHSAWSKGLEFKGRNLTVDN